MEKRRGDSTPPPVERGCIHRPPCRRGSQSWVSISRGTWWERRNIPGWPIPVSPRLPRDSRFLPRPRLDVREGPDGSLPVLVTVSITQLLTAGIAPVPFVRASFPSVSVLHRHRLELRILPESENGRGQEEGDSVGEGLQGRGELTLKDDG